MADTAPSTPLPELQDSPATLKAKALTLSTLIKESKHLIAFTGAGISTSAGIPDFRGPEGAWTLRAQGRERKGETTSTLQAIPTKAHMALVELQHRGILKYLVSQNCDGLHRRSGILPDRISELHGNSNREYCERCWKEYIRDFRAVATFSKSIHDHRTGRHCTRRTCTGPLLDTIINFGENLPEKELSLAYSHAHSSDLCLVLGSSLTVTPANKIPSIVVKGTDEEPKSARGKGKGKGNGTGKGKGKLVICNLQETPLDGLTKEGGMKVGSRADEFMELVMGNLGYEIPAFLLRRRMVVSYKTSSRGKQGLSIQGIDVDFTPVTFLKSVKSVYNRRPATVEPFLISFRDELVEGTEVRLELEFMGHYGEPNLEVEFVVPEEDEGKEGWGNSLYELEYNPQNGEWKVRREDGVVVKERTDDLNPDQGVPDIGVIDLTGDDTE